MAFPIGAPNPSFLDAKLPRTALQIAVMPWAYAPPGVSETEILSLRDDLVKRQPWPKLHAALA